MDLKSHIPTMIVWGYADAVTKKNIKVTREEMYMSDDDDVGKKNKVNIDDGRRKTKKKDSKEKKKKDNNTGQKEKDEKTIKKGQDGEGDIHVALEVGTKDRKL